MNIFHFNETNKSYIYPIIKIIVCVVLIIIFMNSGRVFHIDNTDSKLIKIIISVLGVVVVLACAFCIYISGAELLQAYENREKETALSDRIIANSKQYTIDEIISLVESNDIIEIKIVFKNKGVMIGSSSDNEYSSSKFFDKLYFIEDEMFEEIEYFKSALLSYAINEQISVISIDGVVPRNK